MLAEHASQRDWLLRQHGIDDYCASWNAGAGKRPASRSRIAKASGGTKGHPYPQPLLEDLLSDLIVVKA
jgi:hypothetical protein